jgi:hypothetical protein
MLHAKPLRIEKKCSDLCPRQESNLRPRDYEAAQLDSSRRYLIMLYYRIFGRLCVPIISGSIRSNPVDSRTLAVNKR